MTDRALVPPCQFNYAAGWLVIRPQNKDKSSHVIPAGDLRAHECSGDCWCKPLIDDEDDLIVHNSMDGRERYEDDGAKPN